MPRLQSRVPTSTRGANDLQLPLGHPTQIYVVVHDDWQSKRGFPIQSLMRFVRIGDWPEELNCLLLEIFFNFILWESLNRMGRIMLIRSSKLKG